MMEFLHPVNNPIDMQQVIAEVPNKAIWVARLSYIDRTFFNRDWKASSTFILYLREGTLSGSLNGKEYHVAAPSIIRVSRRDLFILDKMSPTIDSYILFISHEVGADLHDQIEKASGLKTSTLNPIVRVPGVFLLECDELFRWLTAHLADVSSPYYTQAATFRILQFFFTTAYKFFIPDRHTSDEKSSAAIARQFILLVNRYHHTERFLEFYARELNISTKHLSRSIRRHTGITAVEWLDIFIIIDAKILLSVTNLSIKEISERLRFSSQSFFGKYFRKYVGISPKEYRKNVKGANPGG